MSEINPRFFNPQRVIATTQENLWAMGAVYTCNRNGYGFASHGYGVEIPDPRVTRDEPYRRRRRRSSNRDEALNDMISLYSTWRYNPRILHYCTSNIYPATIHIKPLNLQYRTST